MGCFLHHIISYEKSTVKSLNEMVLFNFKLYFTITFLPLMI